MPCICACVCTLPQKGGNLWRLSVVYTILYSEVVVRYREELYCAMMTEFLRPLLCQAKSLLNDTLYTL